MKKAFVLLITAALLLTLVVWLRPVRPSIQMLPRVEHDNYQVDAQLEPARPKVGVPNKLSFVFHSSDGGTEPPLQIHHARRLHVLLIGQDLATIAHIHPSDFPQLQAEGQHVLSYTFPRAGRYLAAIDSMTNGQALSRQFHIDVAGSPHMTAPDTDFARSVCVRGHRLSGPDRYVQPILLAEASADCADAYQVSLQLPDTAMKAGESLRLGFEVLWQEQPVENLAPYLDAALHLAIVPQDISVLLHEHGLAGALQSEPQMQPAMDHTGMDHSMHQMAGMSHHAPPPPRFGPFMHTEGIIFPKAGNYRLFAQFKHAEQLVVAAFWLAIEEGFSDAEARVVELELKAGQLLPSSLQLTQGDKLVLRILSDVDADLHLHGYDLERRLRANRVTEMRFTAKQSGRFGFELHQSGVQDGKELGVLEIYPAGSLPAD